MAAKARARSREFSRQFWSVLCHACSECCLIIMLFVAAVVSYVATRFARTCRLRAPCMLCSKLDHILHGKAWFSEELVCAAHRLEISRLFYCQSHNKLSHSDDLCERCLLSCDALIGKYGSNTCVSIREEMNSRSRSRRTQLCSCCSEPHKKTSNAHKISETANGRVQDDDVRKVEEKNIAMPTVGHSVDDCFDHLNHGGYRRLKAGCDSESDIHVLDDGDDDGNVMSHATDRVAKDISCHDVQLQPTILPSEDAVPAKPTIGHGLEEINWSQANASDNNLAMPSKAVHEYVRIELPKEKTFLVGIEEVGDSDVVLTGQDEEATKDFAYSANAGTVKPQNSETSSSACITIDQNNNMRNSFSARGNLQSPRLSEIISARDNNSKTQEEVKSFLSQMSSARGFDGPCSEAAPSPRSSIHIDEYKESDATSRRPTLERNNSILEQFDGNVISEYEGECSLDHLKQQVELDRKKMRILYKELEAERSASAVAASEAMAMINRLQEEKASMQMEALQYLRMMEEQADHDQEAIEKLNDLLTEREKELLDLEAELENYRSRLHEESFDVGKLDATDIDVAFGSLNGSQFMRHTMSDFEDEKANILESLSRLEETLGMPSTNRLASDGTKNNQQNTIGGGQYLENPVLEGGSSQLPQEDVNQSVENHKDNGSCSHSDDDKISDVTSLKYEISLLNSRFKALEADQKFLKQVLSSLKCSTDGVQCVQEITTHLRELRRTETEQREMDAF